MNANSVIEIGNKTTYNQVQCQDNLYLTIIEKDFEADTFFPTIDFSQWELIERERIENDAQNDFNYRYETWVRKA